MRNTRANECRKIYVYVHKKSICIHINTRLIVYVNINIYTIYLYLLIAFSLFTQMDLYAYFFAPSFYSFQWLCSIHLWTFLLFLIFFTFVFISISLWKIVLLIYPGNYYFELLQLWKSA